MENTPIYYQELKNFDLWKDADGNRIDIRDMKMDHLYNTINFLYNTISSDKRADKKTCQGFIDAMKEELDSR